MTPSAPVLVARAAELAALEQELLRVGEHGPDLVAVTGVAGVGKSALVDRFAWGVPAVLRARATPWERGRPYGVLQQLLGTPDLPDDPGRAAGRLAEVTAAAGSPCLVLVEDAHWSDPESLQALTSAVLHHREERFLVLLVRRSDVPGVPPSVDDLIDRAARRALLVGPLTTRAVGELALARGVPLHPSMAEQLCTHTGGIARHVVALLEELPRGVWADLDPALPAPSGVQAAVAERTAGLSGPARDLVEAVAVLGSPTRLDEASRLAGLADPLAALDEAQRSGLLAAVERHGALVLELESPMVASAVLAGMGPARRAARHREAATVVDDPARRLDHEVSAAPLPDPALADRLDAMAGERAAEGAWGAAAGQLIRASRLTRDPRLREDRLARAVDALIGAGDVHGAATFVAEIESLRETPLRNAVLGYLAILRGRSHEAETRLTRAWGLVNSEREPDAAALVAQRFVLHSLARCRADDLVGWADRALALVAPDATAAVEAAAIRGLGLAGTGRPAEAVAAYERLAERVPHGAQAQRVQMARGWLHLAMDEVDEARAALEVAVPTDHLGGSVRISLWARAWLARTHFVTGDWDAALRCAEDGIELADRSGTALLLPLLHWTRTQVHVLRGDWAAAETGLRLGDAGARDYEIMRVPSCLARAQYAEAQADYAGVLRALAPLTQPWAGGSIDEPGAWPWPDVYANALVLEGRLDDADEFLARHERLAEARGHRSARARLGYARGRLQGAQGDIEAATASFETARQLLDDLPLRFDRARVNFAGGQTLRRAGKRREADHVMRTARELYAALGATTYVERCDRELKAGGLHAERGDRSAEELTPQERAVSDLVARGMSNREVATELFLSMKTVQYHLTRVYAKLGVRSRSELAALRSSSPGVDEA